MALDHQVAPEDLSGSVVLVDLVDLNEAVGLVGLSDPEVQNSSVGQVALQVEGPFVHEGQDVSAFLDAHEVLEVLEVLVEVLEAQQILVVHHLLGVKEDLGVPFVLEVLEA